MYPVSGGPAERQLSEREPVGRQLAQRQLPELVASAPPTRPRSSAASTAVRLALVAFLGALAVLFLALALVLVLLVVQVSHAGGIAAGLGQAAQQAGQAVEQGAAGLVQTVQDATDPLHPPRYAIQQDPQFDQLQVFHAGDVLGEAGGYRYVVLGIAQRQESLPPAQRLYAHVRRSLITPKLTTILGITVRSDSDPQDFALYQGQQYAFQGRDYKVNWLSAPDGTVTVVRYRDDSAAPGPFVFSGT